MKTTKGIEERKINMREIIHNNDNLQESDINKVVERAKIILVNSKDEITLKEQVQQNTENIEKKSFAKTINELNLSKDFIDAFKNLLSTLTVEQIEEYWS